MKYIFAPLQCPGMVGASLKQAPGPVVIVNIINKVIAFEVSHERFVYDMFQ